MDQTLKGLSEVQQNDCRAALASFIHRHGLADWESTVKVQQTSAGRFSVKIQLAPPAIAVSGLQYPRASTQVDPTPGRVIWH